MLKMIGLDKSVGLGVLFQIYMIPKEGILGCQRRDFGNDRP